MMNPKNAFTSAASPDAPKVSFAAASTPGPVIARQMPSQPIVEAFTKTIARGNRTMSPR